MMQLQEFSFSVNFEPHFLKTLNNRYSHVFTWIDTFSTRLTFDLNPKQFSEKDQ